MEGQKIPEGRGLMGLDRLFVTVLLMTNLLSLGVHCKLLTIVTNTNSLSLQVWGEKG